MAMEGLSLEEENKIKSIKNLFRLKKELKYTAIRYKKSIFKLRTEIFAIKDKILRDIKNLFEHEQKKNFISQ